MLVLQYNLEKNDLNAVADLYNDVVKRCPDETVIALPDGMSLLELDDESLSNIVKNLLHYASLRGMSYSKEC
jgi:hypothetical protein